MSPEVTPAKTNGSAPPFTKQRHKWSAAQRKKFIASMKAKRLEKEKKPRKAHKERKADKPNTRGAAVEDAIIYLEHAKRAALERGGDISDEGLLAILALRTLTGKLK